MARAHGPVTRAALAVGAAGALVLVSGLAAVAGPAGSVAPGARLCVAPGQPVVAAKVDDQGNAVCGSGRTLAVVAAQEAVRLLDESVAALQGRVELLASSTAVSTRTTPVPFAARADGTVETSRSWATCGSGGKALSGSAQTQNAALVTSYVVDGGRGWYFEIKPTGTSPSATTHLICAGASSSGGTTPPAPGG